MTTQDTNPEKSTITEEMEAIVENIQDDTENL